MRVQREAREFADAYLVALRDGGLDAALPLYDGEFFKRTPRDEWRSSRAVVDATLGAIEDFRMAKWSMEALPSGTFVTFEYDVTYSRGRSRDTLTVALPAGAETFTVYGHRVHAPELDAAAAAPD